ncbi:MAG: hypothetical protein P4L45_10230, partial [Ignavibacteriaceae bacterium]|nr:hypothetical protein [Ignavibacteriaceae bacterium]
MKIFILASLFILVNIAFAQTPDTITVETQRIKGFGPFPHSFGILQSMPSESPWIKATPKIKGVPDSLSGLVLFVEQADFMQYTYQNYFAGNISEEHYNSCKKDWNWNPDSVEYTKDLVKVNIAIAAGYDRNGNLVILADRNNNYDLSDDEYYKVPAKIPGQDFWGRYNDLLPIIVKYEYYNGKEIKKDSTWLYLDYGFINYKTDKKDNPIQLSDVFAEHHLGEFNFDGKNYFIALRSDRAVFHNFYFVKVWEKDKDDQSNMEQGQQKGELLKIGNYYFKIAKLSADGKHVTLVKESSVEQKGGNQVGLKALNISSKSISGKNIDLKNYHGK